MSTQDNPFLHNSHSNKIIHSNLFRVLAGVIIGLAVLGGVIFFLNFQRGDDVEELPETGDDVQLAEMDRQLDNITAADEVLKLARVGKEYIFFTDIDYYAYKNGEDVDEIEVESALEDLVNESVLLQAGESEGWIELDTVTFNNPFKDFSKRDEQISQVQDMFENRKKNGTVVEIITVWFFNGYLREYALNNGIEKAKELAYRKIEAVYKKVVDDGMSMEEASQYLVDDESLKELDLNYDGNAYGVRIYPTEIGTLEDLGGGTNNLLNFIKESYEGDVSEIFIEQDIPMESEETVDSYYAFYKLVSIGKGYERIEEWIREYKENLIIEIYESDKSQ